jgi:hypothetical protein
MTRNGHETQMLRWTVKDLAKLVDLRDFEPERSGNKMSGGSQAPGRNGVLARKNS